MECSYTNVNFNNAPIILLDAAERASVSACVILHYCETSISRMLANEIARCCVSSITDHFGKSHNASLLEANMHTCIRVHQLSAIAQTKR